MGVITGWKGGGDSLELAEDVCVLGRDAVGLQHGDPEGEQAADLQVLQGAPQRGVQRGLGLRLRLLRPSWAGGGGDFTLYIKICGQ